MNFKNIKFTSIENFIFENVYCLRQNCKNVYFLFGKIPKKKKNKQAKRIQYISSIS